MRKKIQVVIFGDSGFIGKQIKNVLQKDGYHILGFSFPKIDLTDKKSLYKILPTINKNTVLIFASALTRELGDTDDTKKTNITMAKNVSFLLEQCNIKKLVFLSSADVYGQSPILPITEKSKINPQTPYAESKVISESILQKVCNKKQIPLLIFRYAGIFGPGQINTKYGPNAFIKSIIDGKPMKIWGDGKEIRDFLYVRDLAKIISKLSTKENIVGIYNVATGKKSNFIKIANRLQKKLPKKYQIIFQRRTSQSFDQTFDIGKLKNTLPNLSFIKIDQALAETYNFYLKKLKV